MKFLHHPNVGLLILRISVGGLMLLYGIHKLFDGYAGIERSVTKAGWPEWIAHGVLLGEVVAPLMILVGWFSRIGGILVAFTMLVSLYLKFGWDMFKLNSHGGLDSDLNVLFLAGALAITLLGPGKYGMNTK
jgi:putative oxidoreductase